MRFIEVTERPACLIQQLVQVWERSVKATHLFLSAEERKAIRQYVPQALQAVPHLVVAEDEDGNPAGFMGIEGQALAMLFLAPEARGKGLGKQLLQWGIQQYRVCELAVNEQNPLAKGFYEHMGFRTYRRTEQDEQGNPYPLCYMRLQEIAPLPFPASGVPEGKQTVQGGRTPAQNPNK